MERDAIPLVDKDARLLANKAHVLQPTILPPGMEAHVCCRLVSESSRPMELVSVEI